MSKEKSNVEGKVECRMKSRMSNEKSNVEGKPGTFRAFLLESLMNLISFVFILFDNILLNSHVTCYIRAVNCIVDCIQFLCCLYMLMKRDFLFKN